MKRHVTIPVTPWYIPDPTGDDWDYDPMPINPPKLVGKPTPKPVENPVISPAKTPLSLIASRCFTANLNVSDLRYMALAVLQMQDENCELRERVRLLEDKVVK